MRLSDAAERAQLLGGLTRNQASRQLLRIEPVAELYFGLLELRSPARAKAARRAMKNQRVNEFYWQWRDRKLRRSRTRRGRTIMVRSRRVQPRQPVDDPGLGQPRDSYGDHWLDSP